MSKKTILISGSREASTELLERVRGAVGRVLWNRDDLIVGDASGVDEHVVQLAQQFNMHYMAYGIQRLARNGARRYTNVRMRLNHAISLYPTTLYRLRDEFMVQQVDVVLCFWNRQSAGTKYVYQYACKLGKEAYLIGQDGLIESNRPVKRAAPQQEKVRTGSFERVL